MLFSARTGLRVVVGLLGLLLCSCMQGQAETGSSFRKGVQRDAWKTQAAYSQAVLAHRDTLQKEIPSAYWAPRIEQLRPLKVYTHRRNLVVVQSVRDGMEHGRYVYLPISPYKPRTSWFPKTGVDGYVFRETVVWDEYDYTRPLGY